MQIPEFSFYHTFPDTLKGWDAWRENRAAWYEYWAWNAKRRFHALPEEKGIPVPGTSAKRWHSGKNSGKTGVIGSSRMLPHRYMDEGDKGKGHNRHIKRLERALWQREWLDEGYDVEDAYSASEWYSRTSEWWEDDDTDDDYGTLVAEWYDMGCGDPDCSICEREFNITEFPPVESYEDWCAHCGGPCEL